MAKQNSRRTQEDDEKHGYEAVPFDKDAEDAVVASCVIDAEAYAQARAIVGPEDFFTDHARTAFAAMEKLYPGINELTVAAATAEHVDRAYYPRIVSVLPTSIHVEYYAAIVVRKAFQRRMMTAAGQITHKAYTSDGDSHELFTICQQLLYAVEPTSGADVIDAKGQADRILDMVSRRGEGEIVGTIDFGYRDMDNLIGGMHHGNLVTIGARPSVGKSQLLAEIDVSLRQRGYAVMVANAEMSIEEWNEREIAILTGVSVKNQRAGRGPSNESLAQLVDTISRMQHFWLEEPVTISRIINKARVLHRTKGLDVLLVDYVQLIADTVNREFGTNIRERVGFISRSLKRLAKELGICVIAAAQLNREIEARPDKRPRMSDIKESGDVEQDSDIIMLVHRPALYDPNDEPNITHIYVPKVRQTGEIGCIKLVWHPERGRHFDMAGCGQF